jgi:hypothetical protein
MITREQYFMDPRTGQEKAHSQADEMRFADLIHRRNGLRAEFQFYTGRSESDIDPDTGTEISGKKNGSGDGGFRLKGNTTSAPGVVSSHEEGAGVDDSDQDDGFDHWLSLFDRDDGLHNEMLEKYGLYREHPDATPTWCHLTTRRPKSGKRTFRP